MSLYTTAHPRYTRFTKCIGTSLSKVAVRPNPRLASSSPSSFARSSSSSRSPASRSVRARPGRLSALSVFRCRSVFYGAFGWARRALSSQKWRFPARAVSYGLYARDLATVTNSGLQLARMMFGTADFDYSVAVEVSPMLKPIIFVCFIVLTTQVQPWTLTSF